MLKKFILVLLLNLPFSLCAVAADFEQNSYLNELIEQAKFKRLAKSPVWHALVHYEPRFLLPGVVSRADDPKFFASLEGKLDPEAELSATLEKLFSDPGTLIGEQHPQCAFVARLHWLKEQLELDLARLPQVKCERFEDWQKTLDPVKLTLVFPAAFLSNPASMFGHTLLRLDTRGLDDKSQLLSYAANYAAHTEGDKGLLYAVKGLFGGYHGFFSILPYYERVKKYNDLEKRDIWEYELSFTQAQIELVVKHLWELRSIYFDYYYFDENCAFHLLSLFEVARPELALTPQFPYYAIPGDTARAVVESPDLLERINYRPSLITNLDYHLNQLSPVQLTLVKELVVGETSPENLQVLPETEQAQILDTAFEYLEYSQIVGKIAPDKAAPTGFKLLTARSGLPKIAALQSAPPPVIRPDQGHRSAKFSLAGGIRDNLTYTEFFWRPAYHDLLDPPGGYIDGAEITLFDTAVRYYEQEGLELENFVFADVVSLAAPGHLSKKLAWTVRAELLRRRFEIDDSVAFRLSSGFGSNLNLGAHLKLFALIVPDLQYSGKFEKNSAIGLGPKIGALYQAQSFSVLAESYFTRFGIGDQHSELGYKIGQRVQLTPTIALRAEFSRENFYSDWFNSAEGSIQWYF